MKKSICFFFVLLLSFAPLALPRSLKKDLKITLEERQIQDLTLSGLSLVFYVRITNSSPSDYYLTRYEYRLVVNQSEYIRLITPLENKIRIDAQKQTILSFPLRITYTHLFQVIAGIEEEDKALCYLTGTMTFSDKRKERGKLSFAFSGEFPIFKSPEIRFITIHINNLTIGGADLNFKVIFKNRNGFELLIDRISYRLELEERLIGEGQVRGDRTIESKGEKSFSLPLLLNFFEVGKDVYSLLQQTSAFYRFSGELNVRTIWGDLVIPFDTKGRVPITRTF